VDGKSGDWELLKLVEPEGKICRTYDHEKGTCFIDFYGGDYSTVWLYEKGMGVMFDGPHEQESTELAARGARGKVLSCGQGIGLLPIMIEEKLRDGTVSQLDIVELSEDVVRLTWNYTRQLGNIQLKMGSAWDYLESCKTKYDFIFIDIWPDSPQAIAEGPRIAKLASNALNNGGSVRYWLQEISENLKPTRGQRDYKNSEEPCRICACFPPHANLYGGLCIECADAYDYYLVGRAKAREPKTSRDLSLALQSLGYKTTTEHKLSNGKSVDILVEGNGNKYLVEGKNKLDNSMLEALVGKLNMYLPYKDGYSGLKLVIYGDVKHDTYLKLKEQTREKFGDWLELSMTGRFK